MYTHNSISRASVAFDPDRYGDKELKIATVNKLKQKLRNAIAADLSLAVPFLRLAINDGVGYDAASDDGGPDGSVQYEMEVRFDLHLHTHTYTHREIQSPPYFLPSSLSLSHTHTHTYTHTHNQTAPPKRRHQGRPPCPHQDQARDPIHE
jgi:hypothetical protein